jgi:endoglucanase
MTRTILRVAVAVVALLTMLLVPRVVSFGARAGSDPPYAGYWHTDGTRIVDTAGQTVRVAAVTWYGMESSHWVPAGLEFQRYTTIMDEVKLLGFNTIRLPFSNELVESNPMVHDAVAANPQFRGQHALDVMDAIVGYAQQIGLKIILDNHRNRAARPRGVNNLDEPLWYTPQYPQSAWIRDWQTLARRYASNDALIGLDLRNEPHTDGPGPWDLHAYLHQGATWGPYNGVDNPATDWRLAAEKAGNAVLAVNPHLLIFVEGIQMYPEGGSVFATWWSGILVPARSYPVVLNVPHQLVYSPHDWGPLKWQQSWFAHMTYASLLNVWHTQWGFLLDHPRAPYAAPIWLGEFGTCNTAPDCVGAQGPSSQGRWFQLLLRFLRTHPRVGWSFYALNGTNSNRCQTNNGLLNGEWNNLANTSLEASLRSIQPAAAGATPTPETSGTLLPGTLTNEKPRSANAALCHLP